MLQAQREGEEIAEAMLQQGREHDEAIAAVRDEQAAVRKQLEDAQAQLRQAQARAADVEEAARRTRADAGTEAAALVERAEARAREREARLHSQEAALQQRSDASQVRAAWPLEAQCVLGVGMFNDLDPVCLHVRGAGPIKVARVVCAPHGCGSGMHPCNQPLLC